MALRATPLEARIDVDDYGPKDGGRQLAELEARLGPLPATISSTSRGQDSDSRQHFFLLHEPIELHGKPPIEGMKPNDIHIEIIQSHHRYSVVWPSINPDAYDPSTGYPEYRWYDADGEPMDRIPNIDEFEYLPEAWVDFLRQDEVDHAHQAEQWDGDLPDEATDTERRKVRAIIGRLEGLPDVWAPGSGWHDTVFAAACWLSRIARSNAYHLTFEQALQVLIDHTPTYGSAWPVERIIEQWESALKTTEGQFEEPPPEERPPLLDGFTILEAQSRLPSVLHDGRDFLTEGIAGLPANDTPGALWAHRSRVIKALIGAGFTEQETATLVWMSPAARTLNEDLDGIRKLWSEVDEAKAEASAAEASSSGKDVAPAPASERPDRTGERSKVELLSLQERAFVEGEEWWGSRFMDYYREVLPIMSEPYFRLNRWFILSGIFGNRGVIPRDGESDLILNVYGIMIGPSGSGKSESMTPVYEVFRNFFQGGDGDPDIGGNATAAGLVEALIQRDGKTSWFHADEADATLMNWSNDRGEFRGMKQGITDVYGGRVPAIQRSTKRDISGIHAKAYLSTHLTGIPERVASVVDGPDWETGFINRFVWAEGKRLPRSRQSKRLNIRRNTNGAAPKPRMTAFWAAEFQQAASRLERPDGKPVEMDVEHVVDDRYVDLVETLEKVASESRYPSRLEPTFTRLQLTVMKCAGLIALSEGRKVVTMRDFLIAAHQAEEWATNAVVMVERTDESLRTREVNAIEATIADRDGVMAVAEIHRLPQFRNRRRDVEDLIGELVAQGRVERARRKDTNEEIVVYKGTGES